eukprot:scaffold29296_cov144-Isochrysis_galbana.AAC.3
MCHASSKCHSLATRQPQVKGRAGTLLRSGVAQSAQRQVELGAPRRQNVLYEWELIGGNDVLCANAKYCNHRKVVSAGAARSAVWPC